MFGVVAVLGVPETFEKLEQQAPVDVHLVVESQPITKSATVGFLVIGATTVTFGQSTIGKPLLVELVWVPILIPV